MNMTFATIVRARPLLVLSLAAGLSCSSLALADVPAIVGGSIAAGDQATIALDVDVPQALSYTRAAGVSTVNAYFNWHLFCAETPGASSSVVLQPLFQLPTPATDIWKFPNVFVNDLEFSGSGFQSAGSPVIRIGQSAPSPRYRCLYALPGSSLEPWTVNRGLFADGYGDYVGANNSAIGTPPPQTAPIDPHQNVKVTAQQFPGLVAGREVAVVRVEVQLDVAGPAQVDFTLVDGYNAAALNADAKWCLLTPGWVDGTTPPTDLCNNASILFPGVPAGAGSVVRVGMGFYPTFPGPFYVLVSRGTIGSVSAGTAKQGFAALRTGGGLSGSVEELQDWYPNDSVWYNY